MANDTDGLVLALAIDGLTLGDDQLRAIGSSLLALVRYHHRKMIQMNQQVAIYNTAKALAVESSIGLVWVPALAQNFPEIPPREFQDHLLQLDRSDLIELRPDSRGDSWRADDAACCPPGPMGSVLSWLRICEPNE
jgi:hypothetical protein